MIEIGVETPHIADIMDLREAAGVDTRVADDWQTQIDEAFSVVTAREADNGLLVGIGFTDGGSPDRERNGIIVNRNYRGHRIEAGIYTEIAQIGLGVTK